ncbi:MAG: apolipoprotein N-acyltransferase [Oxalobacteraceae bacterium]|nr:apolipoprotein N-acyltransferase [Oxalobacteraceae bacterium]
MFIPASDPGTGQAVPALRPLSRTTLLLSALAGAATVFAFAPFHAWPLQLTCLALLTHLFLSTARVRDGFLLGWTFGTAALLSGTHWLYVSLHVYGEMPAPVAALAVVLLSASLGLLYGLAMWLAAWAALRANSKAFSAIAILPACWMLADWTRGWIFTGFSWVATGYAHTTSPLAAYAPLIGVYGIGGLAAVAAGSLGLMLHQWRLHLAAISVLIALMACGLVLNRIEWTQPLGKPIQARLLQGNVPQQMKFDTENIEASLSMYRQMITEAPADLIATPETALPLLSTQLPPGYIEQLAHFAWDSNSTLVVGVPWTTGPGIYLNSVIGFSFAQSTLYRYDKHHLVPFGEFIPPGARWFVDLMKMPLGDFGRGALYQAPIDVREQWVLPNICYEDLFGEEIAAQIAAALDRGTPVPSILLNVSNIAWFGDTIALPQHLQISQMRTLETGRPMLRATNTGATAVIDGRGQIVASLPAFTRGTLEASVQGTQGATPYIRLGNTLPIGLALALLALLGLKRLGRSKNG